MNFKINLIKVSLIQLLIRLKLIQTLKISLFLYTIKQSIYSTIKVYKIIQHLNIRRHQLTLKHQNILISTITSQRMKELNLKAKDNSKEIRLLEEKSITLHHIVIIPIIKHSNIQE